MPHRGRRAAATRALGKAPPYAGGVLGSVCHKTRLCVFHVQGHCSRGNTCVYAHGEHELRPMPDLTRTKMCPHVSKDGRCNMGMICPYAHSEEELRPVAANSDVKASLGRPLHVQGTTTASAEALKRRGTTAPGPASPSTAAVQLPAAGFLAQAPQAYQSQTWCPPSGPYDAAPGIWFATPRLQEKAPEDSWSLQSTASTPSAAAGSLDLSFAGSSAAESCSGACSHHGEGSSGAGSNHGDDDARGSAIGNIDTRSKGAQQDGPHYEVIVCNTFLTVRVKPSSSRRRPDRRSASLA